MAKDSQKIITFIFSQKIDILVVFETYFTNQSYFHFPIYILYCTMYRDGKAHEETALIIRSNIRYCEIGKYQRKFLQATCVVIED
jgi:hypothetical protein